MTPQASPRLHVLLATEAPLGVVIRRGPAKWSSTIGWNRETDTFQLGQWVKARLYFNKCDLSPDGQHLLYFALDGQWESEAGGTYIALSRSPFLKALGLWSTVGTWGGSCRFVDNRSYYVDASKEIRRPEGFRRTPDAPGIDAPAGWEEELVQSNAERSVRVSRPLPNGWTLTRSHERKDSHSRHRSVALDRKYYELLRDGCPPVPTDDWEWADWDRHRLVWCASGKLFAGSPGAAGLENVRELHDFNDMKLEAVRAPY